MSGGVLNGIKVVDLTSVVVGPLTTQILADHGADVIKVESPSGDIGRYLGGKGKNHGMSPKFLHLNRNKRSICLDLKSEAGYDALMRLLEDADVLLWNVRPSSMERLRLSYADVTKVNPSIIYCGMYGFSQRGRYRAMPAYDSIIQGASGVADLINRVNGTPGYVPFVLADRTAGLIAVQLIAMALFHRERTGEGQNIEVPMLENMVTQVMTEHMYQLTYEPPIGTAGDPRVLDKNNAPIPTKDGYICVSANTDQQAYGLFDAIGRSELKSDPKFSTVAARFQHVGEYFELRRLALAQRTTAEWMELFEQYDVPAAPFNTLESLLSDPHLQDVGIFCRRAHPTEGTIYDITPANTMSYGMREEWIPAPQLGQHTRQVLAEIGLSEAEINNMLATRTAFSAAIKSEASNDTEQ